MISPSLSCKDLIIITSLGNVLLAVSHSRGILLGVKEETFEVKDIDRGDFFLSMTLYPRSAHLKLKVIIVYGPADHSRSAAILVELQDKVHRCWVPILVAGDFKLIRSPSDKSATNIDGPVCAHSMIVQLTFCFDR